MGLHRPVAGGRVERKSEDQMNCLLVTLEVCNYLPVAVVSDSMGMLCEIACTVHLVILLRPAFIFANVHACIIQCTNAKYHVV